MTVYEQILSAAEAARPLILKAHDYIWHNPELGYREFKTSSYMADAFRALGYELTMAEHITGFYTELDTGREGPTVLVMGELDALVCPTHPECDPETGVVHCCGHSAQAAGLLGVAAILKDPGISDFLCGKIRLCAVPAEEFVDLDYRRALRDKGIIKYMGGKTEFLHRGYFDGVDMAFMVHTTTGPHFSTGVGSVGLINKKVTYHGKAAHAGGGPWDGINALYAANQGIAAVNAIRETFREPDIIRFHPIMTSGGETVNIIPDRAVLDSYVRGSSFDAIKAASKKIDRALIGGALSLGAEIEIENSCGYGVLHNAPGLIREAERAFKALYPDEPFDKYTAMGSGSTDMGDLSAIMPVIHPYAPGAVGGSHGNDYRVADLESACIRCAAWQVSLLYGLLGKDATAAKEILATHTPPFGSKKEYLDFIDTLTVSGSRITYNPDNTATVQL